MKSNLNRAAAAIALILFVASTPAVAQTDNTSVTAPVAAESNILDETTYRKWSSQFDISATGVCGWERLGEPLKPRSFVLSIADRNIAKYGFGTGEKGLDIYSEQPVSYFFVSSSSEANAEIDGRFSNIIHSNTASVSFQVPTSETQVNAQFEIFRSESLFADSEKEQFRNGLLTKNNLDSRWQKLGIIPVSGKWNGKCLPQSKTTLYATQLSPDVTYISDASGNNKNKLYGVAERDALKSRTLTLNSALGESNSRSTFKLPSKPAPQKPMVTNKNPAKPTVKNSKITGKKK
jgi:hypothetical protein